MSTENHEIEASPELQAICQASVVDRPEAEDDLGEWDNDVDQELALSQGWGLFHNGERLQVEKYDECTTFESDTEAVASVAMQAVNGCKTAMRAMRDHGKVPLPTVDGTLEMIVHEISQLQITVKKLRDFVSMVSNTIAENLPPEEHTAILKGLREEAAKLLFKINRD